jgi:hypothetical protein
MALNNRSLLGITLVALAALAACGSSTPTAAPQPNPSTAPSVAPATSAPATSAAPVETRAPDTSSPSSGPIPLPSFQFTPDPTLAAEFPVTIQGAAVAVVTYHAKDVLATLAGDERSAAAFNAFLAAVGHPMDDVTLGTGATNVGESFAGIGALRVAGVDQATLLRAASDFALASQSNPADWTSTPATLGGKSVNVLTNTAAENPQTYPPIYLYGHGDTVFTMVSNAVAAAVFAALP